MPYTTHKSNLVRAREVTKQLDSILKLLVNNEIDKTITDYQKSLERLNLIKCLLSVKSDLYIYLDI